jgi:ABC-2 type transport system permease protein
MTRVMTVFWYELRRNFLRKGYLFGTFGLPLILIGLIFVGQILMAPSDEEGSGLDAFDFEAIQTAGLVDEAQLFDTIPESLASVLSFYDDEASAREALQNDEIDVFYVVASDYETSREVTIHLPALALSLLNTQPVEQLIYETLLGDVERTSIDRLRIGTTVNEFNLQRDADAAQDEDADFIMIYAFTITFFLGIFLTNNYLLQSVIEEKENHVVEILLATIRPVYLLRGKILAMSVLGLLQIIVLVSALLFGLILAQSLPAFQTATALLNISIPWEKLPLMLIYFVLGYLFFGGGFAAIGALSNSMREGPQYAAILTLPAVIPFYFITLFLETPNATIPVIFSMIPITSPVAMIMRLSITTVPILEIVLSIVFMVLGVLFMVWVAGRIFRVQTLLAGQTPKLREIPSLIFR